MMDRGRRWYSLTHNKNHDNDLRMWCLPPARLWAEWVSNYGPHDQSPGGGVARSPNPDGPDDYGRTHVIVSDAGRI